MALRQRDSIVVAPMVPTVVVEIAQGMLVAWRRRPRRRRHWSGRRRMHWCQRWWQPRWDEVETNDEESLACRLSDDEHGHSELNSLGKGCPVVDRSVGVQCEIVELMTAGVQTTIHVDILFEAQGQRPGVELGQEAAPSGANDSSPGWFDSVRVDERSAWIEESVHPCLVEARSAEGDEYMDGKKISGSEIQVPMSTQANVGDGMQPSSVLRGLQRSLTDSPEIRRHVVDRPVGVPRETVELMTARDQTEENDDARVRSVLTSPRRPSNEMLDEQAAQGTLTLTTVAAVAERRVFEEARTNPPEGCSSGSEEETRASPTVSTHRGDS